MSNSTIPPTAATHEHPEWCGPDYCEDLGDGKRNHTSAPVTIETFDTRYQIDLEHLTGATPMVWLFAQSKVVDQMITVYIDTDSEVDALITALTALRDLARGGSTR